MKTTSLKIVILFSLFVLVSEAEAQIQREFEIKVTDSGLYFDGEKRTSDKHIDNPGFEYYFGRRITPHGDCIKKSGDFLFLSWWMGGEENKNVMLSRLHIPSQTLETVKFPHTHVGYQHKYPHIGDSHNTIAVAVCPLDSTVHLLYDMHSYSKAEFPDSYFNYQVSLKGAANAPVGSFTIDQFNPRQTYLNSQYNYSDITYPNFFLNNNNELFVWFREGGNNNGMYKFAKYDGQEWGPFTNFSSLNAKTKGSAYNWGLYGDMKYINGKLRVGFLKRMSYNDDKYVYNNGFHYAYTNDPAGKTEWYNYKGEGFTLPLIKPEKIFFYEPGDVVTQGGANSVKMSSGADFTVTDEEAVHFITNGVKSMVDGTSKNVHAYKKAGDDEFTTTTNFPGGKLYAVDGNQVYLMSINNNRPEIYRTEGGTNNWEKLYTETSGIAMEHSNVLIADGKMFVYAMQKSSGDARPIYIQMYDLGLEPIDSTRYLRFKNLTSGHVIELGSDLTIEAKVGSAFKEVSLWLGDTNLGTLTSAPYVWSGHSILTDMNDASYTFKLVAKDSSSAIVEKTITIKTNQPSVNGFSGEGQYKFYNIGKSKWMGYDVATDDALVTDAGDAAINKFNVKANGDQFNIYTGDDQKVVVISSSAGYTSMLATPTSQVLASGDALFNFDETSFGSELYFMVSGAIDTNSGKGYKLNVKSSGTDIGRGTSELSNYQWQLTRLGDLVSVNEVLKENEVLSIYPNPAKDRIYFKGAKLQNARIFSLSGQLIRNAAVFNNQMNVSELKGGIYVLQLEDVAGKHYIKKLVIK